MQKPYFSIEKEAGLVQSLGRFLVRGKQSGSIINRLASGYERHNFLGVSNQLKRRSPSIGIWGYKDTGVKLKGAVSEGIGFKGMFNPRAWAGETAGHLKYMQDKGVGNWFKNEALGLKYKVNPKTKMVRQRSALGLLRSPLTSASAISGAAWGGMSLASGDSPKKALSEAALWGLAPAAAGGMALGSLGIRTLSKTLKPKTHQSNLYQNY